MDRFVLNQGLNGAFIAFLAKTWNSHWTKKLACVGIGFGKFPPLNHWILGLKVVASIIFNLKSVFSSIDWQSKFDPSHFPTFMDSMVDFRRLGYLSRAI